MPAAQRQVYKSILVEPAVAKKIQDMKFDLRKRSASQVILKLIEEHEKFVEEKT